MSNAAYVLEYEADGHGCPYFIAEEREPSEWEWDSIDPNSAAVPVKKNYSVKITDTEISDMDFDFYGTGTKYVSSLFIDVCNSLLVDFRCIPVEIEYSDGSRPKKDYSIFLPAVHLPLMDLERSNFEVEKVVETGEAMTHRYFPGVPFFSKIDKFTLKDIPIPPLFECVELGRLVCNATFRNRALQVGLRGVNFIGIDESFTYDPWAEWS
ncbi:hypothetical protein [Massilia sp.]|uniref:hypothetical protein n=1 Tax=Massilia sp. TaxID=1882437 RepID=UPI00289D38B4|nr:hypothetical protein [Massilia sp.]